MPGLALLLAPVVLVSIVSIASYGSTRFRAAAEVSLVVLAAVVIGGRWGLGGVVLGALVVAAYDRVLVDVLTAGLRGLGGLLGSDGLRRADLRDDNFAVFGVALYLATVWRARR